MEQDALEKLVNAALIELEKMETITIQLTKEKYNWEPVKSDMVRRRKGHYEIIRKALAEIIKEIEEEKMKEKEETK